MNENKPDSGIKNAMLSLAQRIQQKCNAQITENNGEDIYYLAEALSAVNSVRASIPKDYF